MNWRNDNRYPPTAVFKRQIKNRPFVERSSTKENETRGFLAMNAEMRMCSLSVSFRQSCVQ
jgi:hypothetical protein